jgi:hypothetical protein
LNISLTEYSFGSEVVTVMWSFLLLFRIGSMFIRGAVLKSNASNKAAESGKEKNWISAPSITLPKGGGAIRGIGEKFAANPVTGTGSMTVPIFTSPGRSGFGPQLSLSYDSGAGNGPFGFGWSLSLTFIRCKTDRGLSRHQDGQDQAPDSDVFILSGAEDLVPEFEQRQHIEQRTKL